MAFNLPSREPRAARAPCAPRESDRASCTSAPRPLPSAPYHEIGRMPIAYRGKDERVERVLMYYCTSSLLALVQDAAEEPSTYCFADTLETKRDALSARRGSCQKSEKPIPTPCAVFRDRNPL